MGAINYKKNKYITLGLNTNEIEDNEDNLYYIQDILEECDKIIEKSIEFNYFQLTNQEGYYNGFFLDIGFCDYVYFDNTIEKNETIKEATKLKKILIELVETCGLVACFPSWCTTYLNEEETKKEINKAIKEIKSDLQKIPIYKKYKQSKAV